MAEFRTFDTGATRNLEGDKLDYEGFISPLVLVRFAQYMHKFRQLPDGSLRDSDNWQKGIPFDSYMKSAFRHFMDWWLEHREGYSREGLEEALCGLIFNAQGYLHETLKKKIVWKRGEAISQEEIDRIHPYRMEAETKMITTYPHAFDNTPSEVTPE